MKNNRNISIPRQDGANITNIAFGTTASDAYALYRAKKEQIDNLEYECSLLIDKYHSEMKSAHIPLEFSENYLLSMFEKDKKKAKTTKIATPLDCYQKMFLERTFSKPFLEHHKITFLSYESHGYHRTALGIILGIADYIYIIQIPLPKNIYTEEDKKMLMGDVKFRVDRLHKSKKDDFVKSLEPVCLPTYDWKKCFDAIEKIIKA